MLFEILPILQILCCSRNTVIVPYSIEDVCYLIVRLHVNRCTHTYGTYAGTWWRCVSVGRRCWTSVVWAAYEERELLAGSSWCCCSWPAGFRCHSVHRLTTCCPPSLSRPRFGQLYTNKTKNDNQSYTQHRVRPAKIQEPCPKGGPSYGYQLTFTPSTMAYVWSPTWSTSPSKASWRRWWRYV